MRAIRSPQILILGLCLFAGLIAFSPNLNSYFLSDDFVQIGKVLHGDYSVVWGQEHGGFFRPLFIWSYFVDSCVWGARPLGYHLTNVTLHALNAFLLFKVADKLLRPAMFEARARTAVAASAAALFLLHPSHSEAVVWISGRADLLATFFVLASLLSFVRYEGSRRLLDLFTSLVCFAVALLAKESAVSTPLLILLIGISRRTRPRLLLPAFGVFMATLGVFVIVRAAAIGSLIGGYGTAQHLNFSLGWLRDRLLETSVRAFVPPLTGSWAGFLYKPLKSPLFYLIVLLVIGTIVGGIWLRRRFYNRDARRVQSRALITLCALFFISLLPTINLKVHLNQTLGERFLYLPTAFTCILIAYLAQVLIRQQKRFVAFVVILLSFYCVSLYRTNSLWREASSLSREIVSQLTASASRPSVTVLNAPDNLRGVPVFHNGLPEAGRFSSESELADVQIVAFQDLQSETDEMLINFGETVTFRPVNQADRFNRIHSTKCFDSSTSTADALTLRAQPCGAAETFFFSRGRINKVSNVGSKRE